MLSKETKLRMKMRRIKRAIPKKRMALLIQRRLKLGALKIQRNGQFGAHSKDPATMSLEEKLKEMQELKENIALMKEQKAQALAEDRKYFNGWAQGYK